MNPGRIFLRPPAVRAGLTALVTINPGRIFPGRILTMNPGRAFFGLLALALLALPVATAAAPAPVATIAA